ncbi:MAG: LysE family translocator [Hydrococcus sp. RU_2_2]|jgi:threonine/homoserine/homoserine lactone efflux protein|nr:LysE family translocator [Hydrococcus sp. RU_2_2]NJP22412.1 LysE family translocator [Hydrococcus sp. CRU_1_1]
MIDTQLIAFIGVVVSLTIIPGATTMLITRSVIARGQSAGFFIIFGSSLGVYVHAILSVLGLSLILVRSAQLFEVVKLLGAFYLVWLGLRSIWCGLRSNNSTSSIEPVFITENITDWKSFSEGLTTMILSPETSVFYLAMLPQFISYDESALTKSFLLASIHILIRISWYSLLTAFFGRITSLLRQPRIKQWIELSSGAALVFLGFKVATAKR